MLLDHDVAVVLLDVNMPGMDGFETARMIRGRERSRHVPIIFLTAYDADPESALKGYELGAVDYIYRSEEVGAILRSKVSVFVELYKARLNERMQELKQISELQAELEHYRGIGAKSQLPVGELMFGSMPIRKASQSIFDELVESYCQALEQSLESQALKVNYNIGEHLRQIADSLGFLHARPRDVVELHTHALEIKTRSISTVKAKALVEEGRFLVLELMGYLAAFYRKYYTGS